ncbi:MAG: CopG family transcriptional regulator [Thermoplasmata archaeon]|nr:MAG: CopG family transcriptional regulator [Thermoplasmata archaeon]
MTQSRDRVSTAVSLPMGLVEEIDQLIEDKVFSSRSEALRYGARLAVLFYKRVHFRAGEYGYEETKRRLKRGKRVS